MIIISDNKEYLNKFYSNEDNILRNPTISSTQNIALLADNFIKKDYQISEQKSSDFWKYGIFVSFAESSQYDGLIKLSQSHSLPTGIISMAGSGQKFHGFHKRKWESMAGNIHLSAFFQPNKEIKNFGTGFMILSAVSALEAIESFDNLTAKPQIKWVNDIIMSDSKVCGVLAQTQAMGKVITGAVIGIGLNVESCPRIEPTSFVPRAGCLNDFNDSENKLSVGEVYSKLLEKLEINYKLLVNDRFEELLSKYIDKSMIIGRKVSIWSDPREGEHELMSEGVISRIGENLELYYEDSGTPITKGRLVLED